MKLPLKISLALTVLSSLAGCGAPEPDVAQSVPTSAPIAVQATTAPTLTPIIIQSNKPSLPPVARTIDGAPSNSDLTSQFPVKDAPRRSTRRRRRSMPAQPAESVSAPNPPVSRALPNQSDSGAAQVWVNSKTGIYHLPGGRWYGNTSEGFYTSEADAIAKGNRASQR